MTGNRAAVQNRDSCISPVPRTIPFRLDSAHIVREEESFYAVRSDASVSVPHHCKCDLMLCEYASAAGPRNVRLTDPCCQGAIMPDTKSDKTRTEIEIEISRVLTRFEKECMGRGPLETRTYLVDDMIVVRLKGVLTPAERQLAQSENDRSQYLLKQVRNELLSRNRPMLEMLIRDIVGVDVQSVHTDISTKTGERIIVFTLLSKPQFRGMNDGRMPNEQEEFNVELDAKAP